MLTSSRKALLLDRLTRDGQLVVASLSVELGVSEDTLRRDLRELAAQGKLVRVHGGALPASPTHVSLDRRRALHAEEKQGLAKVAADLIADGMIVTIDGRPPRTDAISPSALPLDPAGTRGQTQSGRRRRLRSFTRESRLVQVGGFGSSATSMGRRGRRGGAGPSRKVEADLWSSGFNGPSTLRIGAPRNGDTRGRQRSRRSWSRPPPRRWSSANKWNKIGQVQPLGGRATAD